MTISRLYDFTSGTTIQSGQVDNELNQLVTAVNQAAAANANNAFSGDNSFSGLNLFTATASFSAATGLKADVIAEYTGAAGVTIDSVRLKDGMVKVSGTPASGGEIGYASNVIKFHNGTSVKTLATTDDTVPRSYLAGLGLTTGTDTANDIDIAAGVCRDSTNAVNMVLAATLTKRSDAAWAVGSGNGGMDTGAKPNSDTLHIWLIKRSDTGVVDALFSISATSPTMPADYDYKRRIGSRRTDSSGNIINMVQYGDLCLYNTPPALDVDVSNQSTTAVTRTLSVPTGINVQALINAFVSGTGVITVYFSSSELADVAPSASVSPLGQISIPNGAAQSNGIQMQLVTDTSGQITSRSSTASTTLKIATLGWVDRRGKDA